MHAIPRFFQRPSGPLAGLRGSGLLSPRRRWSWVPVPCFLVEHPQAGPLVVDTGLPAAARTSARAVLGPLGAIFLDVRVDEGATVTERLLGRGIDPLSVGVVVMTHLHLDHTGSVAAFPRSTFVVDEREWEAAIRGRLLQGYRRALFDHAYDWRTVDFGSPQVDSFASFGRAVDLFGDGSVRLLSTPGHTNGHMSVLLRLRSGRELLLTGDAAYSRRSIDEELVPVYCADVHRYMRSLREIRRYLELTPSALVICGHDPESWEHVRERYE